MAGSAANETPAPGVHYWMSARRLLAFILARSLNYWTARSGIKRDSVLSNSPPSEPLLRHLTDDKLCRRKATARP